MGSESPREKSTAEVKRNAGFVLFHRRLFRSWIWKDPQYRCAFFTLVMKAEWKDHNGLKRGQLRFSLAWSKDWFGMNESKTRRFLHRCEQDGVITWKRSSGGRPKSEKSDGVFDGDRDGVFDGVFSLITICNYDTYQTLSNWTGGVFDGDRDGVFDASSKTEELKHCTNNMSGHFSDPKKEQPPEPPRKGTGLEEGIDIVEARSSELNTEFGPETVRVAFAWWKKTMLRDNNRKNRTQLWRAFKDVVRKAYREGWADKKQPARPDAFAWCRKEKP